MQIFMKILLLISNTVQFRSRRVITLHNQRDFIFFRQHRYEFEEVKKAKKGQPNVQCILQEVGPRFTLKLEYLQSGVFDGDRYVVDWITFIVFIHS